MKRIEQDDIKITENELFNKIRALNFVKDIEQVWDLLYNLELTDRNYKESKFFSTYALFESFKGDGSYEKWDSFIKRVKSLKSDVEEGMFSAYSLDADKETTAVDMYKELIYLVTDLNINPDKIPKSEIPIFTTNYDRVIDQIYGNYFNYEGFNFLDGFRNQGITRIMDLNSLKETRQRPTVKLSQLHGSLKWRRATITVRNEKQTTIEKISDETPPKLSKKYREPILIYPGYKIVNNLSPFNALYNQFAEYLKKVHFCIIIGCSFRDEAINNIILKSLKLNKNLELIIISPNAKQTVSERDKDDFKGIKKYENEERTHYINKEFEKLDIDEIISITKPHIHYFLKDKINKTEDK